MAEDRYWRVRALVDRAARPGSSITYFLRLPNLAVEGLKKKEKKEDGEKFSPNEFAAIRTIRELAHIEYQHLDRRDICGDQRLYHGILYKLKKELEQKRIINHL